MAATAIPVAGHGTAAVGLPCIYMSIEGTCSISEAIDYPFFYQNSKNILRSSLGSLKICKQSRNPLHALEFCGKSKVSLIIKLFCQMPAIFLPKHLDMGDKEGHASMNDAIEHLENSFSKEAGQMKLPPPNPADDASLRNPLLRLQRMGCGWLGVLLEWEGVMVEENVDLERNVWRALAEEEGKSSPPIFVLKRAQGMKSEQVISEVLCWSRDSKQIKRLTLRKEELYEEGSTYKVRTGSREFVVILRKNNIPIAVVSTRPRKHLERAIEAVGMKGFFNVIIAAEDVYRGKPDPEMFMYSAEQLGFIPERCIVFGSSNSSIEAAHDACMKCVAVASSHAIFELNAADLAVRQLDELSIMDLKKLVDTESPEFQSPATELEPEMKVQGEPFPLSKSMFADDW